MIPKLHLYKNYGGSSLVMDLAKSLCWLALMLLAVRTNRSQGILSSYQINVSPRFQMVNVHDPDGTSDLSETLARLTLSNPTELTGVSAAPIHTASGETKRKHFPGSGHLRHFIRMAEQDKYSRREVVGLVMFAAEGDNSGDAREMASVVSKSINVEVTEWKAPRSWEGVFGEAVRSGAEEGLFW